MFSLRRNNVNVLIRATEKYIYSCDVFKYEPKLHDTVLQCILVSLNDRLFTQTHVFVTVNLISETPRKKEVTTRAESFSVRRRRGT